METEEENSRMETEPKNDLKIQDLEDDIEDIEDDDEDDDLDEDEDDDYYYYSFNDDEDVDKASKSADGSGSGNGVLNNNEDPEYSPYECLNNAEAERFLTAEAASIAVECDVSPSVAKQLLHRHKWNSEDVLKEFKDSPRRSDESAAPPSTTATSKEGLFCDVCATWQVDVSALSGCGHEYCRQCWESHFANQVESQGAGALGLACMHPECDNLAPETFVLAHLKSKATADKYCAAAFSDYVRSHPQLRPCPGQNCLMTIRSLSTATSTSSSSAALSASKRCVCASCRIEFCFKCSGNYHSPTDCNTIKRWLTKCADDSETANYISAHTKDVRSIHFKLIS